MSTNQIANASQRRSSRVDKAIMLIVQGVGASREPYREEVTTGSISCHGCAYQMKHEVRPGDVVVLDSGQSDFPRRARVKSIQKLNAPNNPTYNVGVELEIAGNIWGIVSPPAELATVVRSVVPTAVASYVTPPAFTAEFEKKML